MTPFGVWGQVTSPNTIHLNVIDAEGEPYDPATYCSLQIRYAVFLVD